MAGNVANGCRNTGGTEKMKMKGTSACIVFVLIGLNALSAGTPRGPDVKADGLVVRYQDLRKELASKLLDRYKTETGLSPKDIPLSPRDFASIAYWCDKRQPYPMFLKFGRVTSYERALIENRVPKKQRHDLEVNLGHFRIGLIVRSSTGFTKATMQDVVRILSRQEGRLVPGKTKTVVYGQNCPQVKGALQDIVTYHRGSSSRAHGNRRGSLSDGIDWGQKGIPEVAQRVLRDRSAIGVILLTPDAKMLPRGVVLIKIHNAEKNGYFAPKVAPAPDDNYVLTSPVLLFVSPRSRMDRKMIGFSRFCRSKKGAEICKEYGVITPWHQKQYEGELRLKEFKAGKGVAIRGVGSMGGAAVLRDLAIEYVKAKEVVQMACRPATSELTAVGYFVNAKDRELLVLDGPISEKAKKLHGKKWDFLEPETHVLATGRGIAICVNSMNKLGSLTLEQVRHLFSKKTSSWRDVTGAEVKIKRYGLRGTDPAARVFYNRINPPAVCARPDTRLGTQAVLAALSRDPHGIAFVDAAAANDLLAAAAAKSGIKVLSIGAKGKATSPTAANVKAGKYPISQQLTLHLSPRASQTTRDFVKFVLSGAADEVFTKHGLTTPAQARKAAEAAKKPTGKKRKKR